jgi:WD40 repeat protein
VEVKNQTHTEGPSIVDLGVGSIAGGGDPGVLALDVVPFENYILGEEHARGGLGRILRAHDTRLDRTVAVKEILGGGPQAARRFVREARLTARLQHPSIVPVHEAGRWPTGEPFYTMELISGRSLREIIDERPTLDERLALVPNVIAVSEAIAYAHSKRVIHRDLKPSNVLVGEFGETVVVDWGLAKDLADTAPEPEPQSGPYRSVQEPSSLTVVGHVMGTPAYMPPEQALGEPVDERADVYALGALLYHVLAGGPPYAASTSAAVLGQVNEGPPPRLSLRQPGVPRDLATIVDKAMARDPARRYPSARELAEDLRRFQTGQLVTARVYSWWSLVVRWTRQHAAPVAVGLAALFLLAGTGVVSVRGILREKRIADEQRNLAAVQRAAAEARANDLILTQARGWLDRDPTTALAWLKSYPSTGAHLAAVRDVARDAVSRGVATHVLRDHHDAVLLAAFSPDGKVVVTGALDKRVRVWDVSTGKLLTVLGDADAPLHAFVFSDDGHWLVAHGAAEILLLTDRRGTTRRLPASDSPVGFVAFLPHSHVLITWNDDGTVRRWDADASEPTGVVIAHHPGLNAALSPDGTTLALGAMDGTLALVDTTSGAQRMLLGPRMPLHMLRFSPDGRWLAGASHDGTLQVWELARGTRRAFTGHAGQLNVVAFAPDGRHVASAGADRTVRIWDLESGQARTLAGHQDAINVLEYSPGGALLATGSSDRKVLLWEVASGNSRALLGHNGAVRSLAFSPDGRALISAGEDRTARLWRITDGGDNVLADPSAAYAGHVIFFPDGQEVAVASANGKVHLWDLRTHESRTFNGHRSTVSRVLLLPGGKELLSASWDHTVRLWDLATGSSRELSRQAGIVWMIALSPDGKSVASSDDAGLIRITDLATGVARDLTGHEGACASIAYSPDGKSLASASSDHTVRLWDLAGGTSKVVTRFDDTANSVAFSADGRWLASAGLDGTVHMSSLSDGGATRVWSGHHGRVRSIAFSPDSQRLASAGEDTDVRVWDVASGAVRIQRGHTDPVRRVVFSPDGTWLASASDDRTVRLWDVASGESEILRGHQNGVLYVAFSPEGDRLASTATDGTTRLWRIERLANMVPLRPWLDEQTSEAPAETDTP